MCGVAGHVDWTGSLDARDVAIMTRRIRHRGPDDAGHWLSEDGACALGHARLSILDLSDAGHQPMVDARTGATIVFNGEIYNFLELRKSCEEEGETFVSRTDTEVILALYRRYGVKCLELLRGMFAFAIWDPRQRRLFMARDRVGKKPLYYHLSDRKLVFASEVDALSGHPAVHRDIDQEGLEFFLQLGYIPAPWSIYRAVHKLPPAHYALYDESGISLHKYWDVDYRRKISISEADALDGLEEQLREAIRLRMIADVPIGALLSGGVDSSLVVALMAGLKKGPVRTYSIGFKEQSFNELPFAEMVAARYETDHVAEILEGEVGPILGNLVKRYGEPFADSSSVPSFLVCSTARQHVKVVMNGDGGDELLGGYPRYWLSRASIFAGTALGNLHSPDRLANLVVGLERAKGLMARGRRKWLSRIAHPEIQSVGMYSEFWNEEERAALTGRSISLVHDWRAALLADSRASGTNPIDRMLWMDSRSYLPGDLLVKMDIASMHCGLEARSPLLDHKVIEYCAGLPVEYKVRHGVGKYLLKKLAERYLPARLIYRPKMGFGIPLAGWLRGPLRPAVQEALADRQLTDPLDGHVVQATWREFLAGDSAHGSRVWAVFMFALWRRHCLVSREAAT